jgi:dipeptidyl aminopeptidase/acylaminoacyl peptidase
VSDASQIWTPAWSADGRWIAYVDNTHGANGGDLHVIHPDGSGDMLLRSGVLAPDWSPAEDRLVVEDYVLDVNGEPISGGLSVMSLAGAWTLIDRGRDDNPRWSPDGSQVAFVQLSEGPSGPPTRTAMVVNADGTGVRSLGPADSDGITWSPDGRRVAFVSHGAVVTAGLTDSRPTVLSPLPAGSTPNQMDLAWSPSGDAIALVDEATASIRGVDVASGKVTALTAPMIGRTVEGGDRVTLQVPGGLIGQAHATVFFVGLSRFFDASATVSHQPDGTDAVSFIVPDMVDNVDYDVSVDSVWIGRVTYEHSQAWVRAILLVVLMATTAVVVVRTARRRGRATPASFET